MAPAQSAARRPLHGFRRIGRHKALRRHVVGEDPKISHTTTPETQADSVIIAKEGELCLKHTGFKLEVIDWDHAQTISWRVDPGCEHSFVPLSHIRRLDGYIKHAAGNKFDFERGLRKILQLTYTGTVELYGVSSLRTKRFIAARKSIMKFARSSALSLCSNSYAQVAHQLLTQRLHKSYYTSHRLQRYQKLLIEHQA
jgi:hypothetical protein